MTICTGRAAPPPPSSAGRSGAGYCRDSESGLRLSSAANVLEMLAPVALAVIGREVVRHGLDEAGLVVLLADRRHDDTGILPAAGVALASPQTGGARSD